MLFKKKPTILSSVVDPIRLGSGGSRNINQANKDAGGVEIPMIAAGIENHCLVAPGQRSNNINVIRRSGPWKTLAFRHFVLWCRPAPQTNRPLGPPI